MNTQIRWLPLSLAAFLVIAAIFALFSSIFADEIFPEYSPAHRGFKVALKAGCFSCHSLDETSGTLNPTTQSNADSVPSLFSERHSLDHLHQWIENGITDEKAQSDSFLQSRETRILKMPAYGEHLDSDEIEDLVVYLALMQYSRVTQTEEFRRLEGERLTRKYSCFTCHGELGQGGVENPRSLKGYIPGFFGSDFRALTQNGNREDIRQWILEGMSHFFRDQGFTGFHPGRYLANIQAIQMPAYEGVISNHEVEIMVDYLVKIMELGPMDAEKLLEYQSFERSIPDRIDSEEPGSVLVDSQALVLKGKFIFEEYCVECHGPDKQRSRYRLDSRDEAIKGGEISDFLNQPALLPGNAAKSLLIRYVEATEEIPAEELYPMPPGERPKLTADQIEVLRAWIDTGFEWLE